MKYLLWWFWHILECKMEIFTSPPGRYRVLSFLNYTIIPTLHSPYFAPFMFSSSAVHLETENVYCTIINNKMHYLLSIYFNNSTLHVLSRFTAHHHQVLLCIQQLVYVMRLCWLAFDRIQPTATQHKRITYTNCCIYRVIPPDEEQ